MNRLSLLNGPLPTNQKQNIKQAAYFQYLKSFAQTSFQTLQKLQMQFNKHLSRQNISQEFKIFKKITTLLSSYQVFVLQINDSCQFIQVPQLGSCIVRLFIQLIGILKWTIQHLVSHKKVQSIVTNAIQQNRSNNFSNQKSNSNNDKQNSNNQKLNNQRMNNTCDKFQSYERRDTNGMRNTFNGNLNNCIKQTRCSECMCKIQGPSNEIYKVREQTTMQLKDINQEILRISKQYNQEQKMVRQQQIQKNQLKKFIQKRQNQGKQYGRLGIGQQSRNQQILSEILYTLNRKGEAIGRFADLRITSLNETTKIQQQEDYENLKSQMNNTLCQKVNNAKHKLSHLFKEHLHQYQKLKRQQMVDVGVQLQQGDSVKLYKLFQQKLVKQLKSQLKKVQKQLQCQKDINSAMRKLLQQKSIQFEGQVMKYRNQLINLQFKSRKDIFKSNKKNRNNKENDSFDISKKKTVKYADSNEDNKSVVSIDIRQFQQTSNFHMIKYTEDSFSSSPQKLQKSSIKKTKNFLQTGKRLSKNKSSVKFRQLNNRSFELQLASSTINYHFSPKLNNQLNQCDENLQWNCLPKIKQIIKKQDVAVQTNSEKTKQKHKSGILQKSFCKREQFSGSKTPKPSQSKNRINVISYTKKRSSHMGQLSNYFQIKVNKQDSQQQNKNIYNRLLSKKSKLTSRKMILTKQEIQERQKKNDFIPIVIPNEFKSRNNYISSEMNHKKHKSKCLNIKNNYIDNDQSKKENKQNQIELRKKLDNLVEMNLNQQLQFEYQTNEQKSIKNIELSKETHKKIVFDNLISIDDTKNFKLSFNNAIQSNLKSKFKKVYDQNQKFYDQKDINFKQGERSYSLQKQENNFQKIQRSVNFKSHVKDKQSQFQINNPLQKRLFRKSSNLI